MPKCDNGGLFFKFFIMKKILLLNLFLILIGFKNINAQFNCTYLRSVTPTPNVSYTSAIGGVQKYDPNNGIFTNQTVFPLMDIYKPNLLPSETNTTATSPVFIYCHGNGEDKGNQFAQNICNAMAERGFLAVSINFRNDYGTAIASTANNALTNKNYSDRVFYSNAMDVRLAMNYLVQNAANLRIDVNGFVIGGFSLGAATTTACLYMDKDEVATIFPTNTFNSDPRYINIDAQQVIGYNVDGGFKQTHRIRAGYIFSGGITDESYIDQNENTPIFIMHGTHDALVPFYTGRMLCSNVNEIKSGGARIAQIQSNFSGSNNTTNSSYYFIRVNGMGHVVSPNCSWEFNSSNPFIHNMWFPDFYRYIIGAVNTNILNRRYKLITPINPIYNFCQFCMITSLNPLDNNCAGTATAFWVNGGNNSLQYPNSSCFPTPTINYNQSPWYDYINNKCGTNLTAIVPQIALNTSSNTVCYQFTLSNGRTSNSLNNINNLQIYPNPTSGKLNINLKLDNVINGYNVSIFSVDGKNIYNNTVNETLEAGTIINNEFDVSNQANGIYFIRVTSENNLLLNQKFVLNK